MERKNRFKKILVLGLCLGLVFTSACASLRDKIAVTKGQLIGTKFKITSYDFYGNKTLSMDGRRVNIASADSKSDSQEGLTPPSSVLEITINGQQLYQVGNTLIFAEEGLDMVEDFQLPKELEAKNSASLVPLDRYVNDIKNKLGKEKTVIISSPMGIPIGVFEGKKVFATIPKDLPKMTRLNIDGKSLYIHRANYMIIDTDAIN